MKVRFPLWLKVCAWLLMNLLFLGVVLYVFFRVQFRMGLDSLLMGRAGDRIQAVSELIALDLNENPRSEWTGILARFSTVYHLDFHLFLANGAQVAGPPVVLPSAVRSRLNDRAGPRRIPLYGMRRPAFDPPHRPDPERPDEPQPPRPRGQPLPVPPEPPANPGPLPKWMVHTEEPARYWVIVRLPLIEFGPPRPMAASLVASSPSIRGGGLFLDVGSWLAVGLMVVVCSILFWIPLVRGIARALAQLTSATEQIAQGQFDVRVNENRRDELGSLGQAVNRMATRLSGFVTGQRRFMGDIAHELCSPLARIQLALGILEQRADEKQQGYVEDLREEVEHMSSLVNELLSFSKAGIRPKDLVLQPVSLRPLIDRVVAREAPAGAPLEIDIAPDLRAWADAELLARALANLLRNALRYAGSAGPISLQASRVGSTVQIRILDSGPGIPKSELPQIFDPFYRPEAARDRESGGVGLGLSIVRTCIEACRGTVTLKNRQPAGLEAVIDLQAATMQQRNPE